MRRGCIVLRGSAEETRAEAERLVSSLPREDVLFVTAAHLAKRALGRAYDAVVLDLHEGLDADVLGQVEGLVWGGGTLIVEVPRAPIRDARLAVFPFAVGDVGTRFWQRLERRLSAFAEPARTVAAAEHARAGTTEQDAVVATLVRSFASEAPSLTALLADRGRGKSAALGLALARARGMLAISGPSADATREIARFAPGVPFVEPEVLARSGSWDVIAIDEAAQLSVPLLQRIATRHARARIALATTTRGYEGTGRGFVLRFLEWAQTQPRRFELLRLEEPIRWAAGDPLERFVMDALVLDAELPKDVREGDVEHVRLDRDRLANDEQLLRDVFGLLVHAHYRTRPSDLSRMLDAPNLAVHASLRQGRALAATLIAKEGNLPRATCEAMLRGAARIQGHALPDTLVTHAARPEAGELSMVRSVRIAVHPDARRLGVARGLVEHVHASYAPDLFGTMFGATPALLQFRRSVGYELARVGVSRGARTGEPSAVMLRPVSARAIALVEGLRLDLARNLDLQLELLAADGILDDALARSLRAGLPSPAPLSREENEAIVRRYADSVQPADAIAFALARFVSERSLDPLDPRTQRLLLARLRDRRGWTEIAGEHPNVRAAMRALRPAIRSLLRASEEGASSG